MASNNEITGTSSPVDVVNEQPAVEDSGPAKQSPNLTYYKWINLIAQVINVLVTYGIGTYGMWGETNSEISERYQTIVTPAGFAFSIWGIIFIAQAVWMIRQFIRYRASEGFQQAVSAIGWKYAYVVLMQVGWTLVFSQELLIGSLIMMILIWISLALCIRSLSMLSTEPTGVSGICSRISYYGSAILPFAVHFGWISAASIVNINVVVVSQNASTMAQYVVGIIGLVVLVLFGLGMLYLQYITVPLVLAWALFGVYSELSEPKDSILNTFSDSEIETIRYLALSAMSLILAVTLVQCVRLLAARRRSSHKAEQEETSNV
jgi:hypothetical protein